MSNANHITGEVWIIDNGHQGADIVNAGTEVLDTFVSVAAAERAAEAYGAKVVSIYTPKTLKQARRA